MDKISPYEPITPELAASGLLIPIKHAAEFSGSCDGTLRANAKARRLRAFQQNFGTPVMVLPSDVEDFLTSRSDIASKFHPKGSPEGLSPGLPPTLAKPKSSDDLIFPEAFCPSDSIGDHGVSITLPSLAQTSSSDRALVVRVFIEVARQINETIPTHAGNQPQS